MARNLVREHPSLLPAGEYIDLAVEEVVTMAQKLLQAGPRG